jgi:hypothetical protein
MNRHVAGIEVEILMVGSGVSFSNSVGRAGRLVSGGSPGQDRSHCATIPRDAEATAASTQ